ncbi:MAG TPA: aminopeptidase, partial [Eubacteriaceae bacterium]|nr:aminopeptidase [Eubacteriaceae bacterium]
MNQMNNMKKYADLALQKGINLQKGQALVVSASVENADLVRLIGKRAYELGAKEVHVNWRDGVLTQLKFKHAPLEIFEDFPDWYAQAQVDYAKKGAGFLTITGDDPQLLNGISSEKIAANNRSSSLKMKELRKYTMGNFNSWCIIAAPTIGWAEALYDDAVEEEEKIDRLGTAIFKANRVDQADPIAAWENHLSLLAEKVDLLNAKQYRRFVITSDNGTSLDIRLPNHHIWWGGGEENKQGTYFVANMPTEEVFTAPDKTGD